MSMIPADLPAIHSAPAATAGGIKRLPRALGWLSAAIVSVTVWGMAIEAIRLAL